VTKLAIGFHLRDIFIADVAVSALPLASLVLYLETPVVRARNAAAISSVPIASVKGREYLAWAENNPISTKQNCGQQQARPAVGWGCLKYFRNLCLLCISSEKDQEKEGGLTSNTTTTTTTTK
jgi:hypothetical protein